ncbi:hypothetical protein [uncultured Mitsuokella sp.]|uniref:hypothetical protein n=1 Tax=uncultured Mitsuokella sp. TaxID=453120 RepID=UPI0026DCFF83|nr:hypothetical protein [uncultured Mitsuokella sp.]
MKDETRDRVEADIKDWAYLRELPDTWHGFTLQRLALVAGDCYDIYRYENEELHKSVTAYFHEETHEYKLRVKIGLIEFCRIEFITAKFDVFEALLRAQFETVLAGLAQFDPASIGSIVRDKKIMTWEAAKELPETLEGFTLYIRPAEPVKINNGSYIVIDYVDFTLESSVTVYYNIYRDEFFSEARIWNIPDVNYDFDSGTLSELEERLQTYLVPRLQEVRTRAEEEAAARRKKAEAKQQNEEAEEQPS